MTILFRMLAETHGVRRYTNNIIILSHNIANKTKVVLKEELKGKAKEKDVLRRTTKRRNGRSTS